MCGIVGIVGARSREEATASVKRMNDAIVHRGPDDDGVWSDGRVAVAMRRLSIIDLVGGHQPMIAEDGVVIVFNGEIYNHRALRAGLERDGFTFRTQSDTEVILQLYRRDGIDGLQAMEGMFAICIVDQRSRRLHLIRDRIGIKPLYYGSDEQRFYFASELKSIIAGMPRRPAVNPQAVFDFLTLRFVQAPQSIWKGLLKLPPGHRLCYDLDHATWTVEPYWSLRFSSEPLDPSRNYPKEFEERFHAAVESHIAVSDVPVGVLLSGGLDSSAVLAAAVETGHRNLATFSVGFEDGGEYNETSHARAVAKHLRTDHHEIVIGRKEFLDFLPELVWHTDEPLSDLAAIPLHYVSRLARERVKVVVSGEGADELFAGYNMDQMVATAHSRGQVLKWIPPKLFSMASYFVPEPRSRDLRSMGTDGWSGYFKARATHPTSIWSGTDKHALWRGPSCRPTEDHIREAYGTCESREPEDLIQHVWCQDWLVEDLLMKADKMTMANSIELRVPFLTHSMVEWAQRLPVAWRIGDRANGYMGKRIIRQYAEKRLPSDIVNRPKQGFPVPAYEWLRTEVGDWAQAKIEHAPALMREWLDIDLAKDIVGRGRSGDTDAAYQAWALIVLAEWCDRWL